MYCTSKELHKWQHHKICMNFRIKVLNSIRYLLNHVNHVNHVSMYRCCQTGPAFSYKLRYIVGFWLVSTNQKPTIYRNLYENMDPDVVKQTIYPPYFSSAWYSLKKVCWLSYRCWSYRFRQINIKCRTLKSCLNTWQAVVSPEDGFTMSTVTKRRKTHNQSWIVLVPLVTWLTGLSTAYPVQMKMSSPRRLKE